MGAEAFLSSLRRDIESSQRYELIGQRENAQGVELAESSGSNTSEEVLVYHFLES